MKTLDLTDTATQLEERISAAERLPLAVSADPTSTLVRLRQLHLDVQEFSRRLRHQHESKIAPARPTSPLLYRTLSNEQARSEFDLINDWTTRLDTIAQNHLGPSQAWSHLRHSMKSYLASEKALRSSIPGLQGDFAELGIQKHDECEQELAHATQMLDQSISACQGLGIWLPTQSTTVTSAEPENDTVSSWRLDEEDMETLVMAQNEASLPPSNEDEYFALLDLGLGGLYFE